MEQRLLRLALKFSQQQEFSDGYSPLYARLFGTVAGWLAAPTATKDPLVRWLLDASRDRQSLDVTLLLAAGLHRDILAGERAVHSLARFFPTAGGDVQNASPGFEGSLRQAILDRRETLGAFLRHANVQTNETGRGLCWVLPLLSARWEGVHLVDLGASAGLNLVANRRAYRLVPADGDQTLLDLGHARPVQFVTRCQGAVAAVEQLSGRQLPAVASRTGCDLSPFPLSTPGDRLTLMAFVWGDQVERLQRLREGIEAFRDVQQTDARVRLFPVDLPSELDSFLRHHVPSEPRHPVVVYNTYMTSYLDEKGSSLQDIIGRWAGRQKVPVLWLQWEPHRDGIPSPQPYWVAWTADLWWENSHAHWLLGWVHPHGGDAFLEPGMEAWNRDLASLDQADSTARIF